MGGLLKKSSAIGYFTAKLWRLILFLIVIVISILYFPVKSYLVPGDSVDNLLSALKLYNGEAFDFRLTLKGPLFPWLISVAYKVFGVSEFSGMLVVRLFYSLNIIMVYILASKLFTRLVGMCAALLVVSSYLVMQGSLMLMYDTIFPFGILLFIYLCVLGLEKEKGYVFVLAGIWLGITLTIRQDAILFFFLPWLAFLFHRKYFSRKIAVMNILFSVSFIAPIIVFIMFLVNKEYGFSSFLGTIAVKGLGVPDSTMNYFLFTLDAMINKSFATFWWTLTRLVEFKYLYLIFGWIGVLVLFIFKRDKGNLILLLCMLLFLPLIVFTTQAFRIGRIVPVLDLTYIALASAIFYSTIFLTDIAANIYPRLETKVRPLSFIKEKFSVVLGHRGKPVIVSIVLIFVYGNVFVNELKISNLLKQPTIITWVYNPSQFFFAELEGGVRQREVADWMRKNMPTGAKVAAIGIGTYMEFRLRDKFYIPQTTKWDNVQNIEEEARMWDYLSVCHDQKSEGWWDAFNSRPWAEKVFDNDIVKVYKIAKKERINWK